MSDTFFVYRLRLTEAGFQQTAIAGCTHAKDTWGLDIECPDGTYIEHDNMNIPIYIELRAEVHYYSKSPDFRIGREAIFQGLKARIEKSKKAIETMENLLKYEKA